MIKRSKKFKNHLCQFEPFFQILQITRFFLKNQASPLLFLYHYHNLKPFLHVLTDRHMKVNFKEFPVIVRIEK